MNVLNRLQALKSKQILCGRVHINVKQAHQAALPAHFLYEICVEMPDGARKIY